MVVSERTLVNTRCMSAGLTGVQRYIGELSSRLAESLECVAPRKPLQGFGGHLWEQLQGRDRSCRDLVVVAESDCHRSPRDAENEPRSEADTLQA